jgi:clan AA aspartic protease (TIGR02281 family)
LKFPLQSAGPIILPCVLTGPKAAQKADLLLDTGAEYCSITTWLATNLGYDLDAQLRKVAIITANGSIHVPSVLVTEVRVGSAYAQHVAVTCQNIPEMPEVEGFIGLNFLRRCRTVIDYQKQVLVLVRFKIHT